MISHPIKIDSKYAALIARRFIERGGCDCEFDGPECPKVKEKHFEYHMIDGSIAYEFPLVLKGKDCGYIIVSGTRALPPILEFCGEGQSLSKKLINSLNVLTKIHSITDTDVSWRYFGPLDIAAEIVQKNAKIRYVRLPNLHMIETDEKIMRPAPIFRLEQVLWIEKLWKYYDLDKAPKGELSCSTMFGFRPVKYNQTCQSSLSGKENETYTNVTNYCTPDCIVGCVATGWTVLASTWHGFLADSQIFSDAPDWKDDWESSYGGPPSPRSKAVNRRMWAVHGYLNTSCDGISHGENCLAGSRIFSDYGVNWYWGERNDVDYNFASGINKVGQVFLLTAQSDWTGQNAIDGHGVVVHGWNDNDQHLLISLGWGASFPDKWIAFSSLSRVSTYFRANPHAQGSKAVNGLAEPYVMPNILI